MVKRYKAEGSPKGSEMKRKSGVSVVNDLMKVDYSERVERGPVI